MAVQIIEATIHHLDKAAKSQGPGSVIVQPRAALLPIDDVLQRLCDNLVQMYGRVANSNGTLGTDPIAHKFPVHLKHYLDGGSEFVPFTRAAIGLVAERMKDAFLASGGYALFLRYRTEAQDFVLVAMLKLKPGAGIAAGTLDLTETLNIDLAHLNEAARINLTRWQGSQQPYLTFIKGATRQAGISDYFRDALACTSYTDSKHHTNAVLQAAMDFVDARDDLTLEAKRSERLEVRRRLYECLDSNREEVPLETVAAAVHPTEPQDFLTHVASNQDRYHLDARFKPDRKTYVSLKRVSGKIGTVSLSFEVADVRQERVRYDPNLDAIILKSPSQELKTAIQDHAPASD